MGAGVPPPSDLFQTISQEEFDRLGGGCSTEKSVGMLGVPPPPDTFDIDGQMQICSYCGCCEEPDHCVYGVQCPECCAPPTQQCTNPNGGLTGLHEERHRAANSPFWREYRCAS